MKKINCIDELNKLIMSHFGRDYVSNWFMPKETAVKYISADRITACESGESLFIFLLKGDFSSLYYCMKKGDIPDISLVHGTVVAETAYRDRDTELRAADSVLESIGFEREFCRCRMSFRQNGDVSDELPENIRYANEEDKDIVKKLLYSSFNELTGCLPDDDEITAAVCENRFLLYDDGSEPSAVLHFEKKRSAYELRHLCVSQNSRGRGIGGKLVKAYNAMIPKNGQVWVREGYAPAEKIYEKNGYTADGMKSSVLIYRKG